MVVKEQGNSNKICILEKGRLGIALKLLVYNTHQIVRTLSWQQSKRFFRKSSYPFLGGSIVSIMVVSEVCFEEYVLRNVQTSWFVSYLESFKGL